MKQPYPFSKISLSGELIIHHSDAGNTIKALGTFSRPMKSGVYELVNKQEPDKTYIGKSNNLDARMKAHFYKLNRGTAISKFMQQDYIDFCGYNSDGENYCKASEDLFEFRIILYARPSELTFYENILINTIKPFYNQKKEK